ncbi:MAG: hypothetical protein DRN12_05815 [Thermoplasmata archaeon]|nr:MAG: hypothetical protein DRN12_05815 [Thermoplasmata archaeon]HEC86664.1 hypothetical protein [Thermoplasmatales archaeon]
MACFLAPATEAVATTIIQKMIGREKAEKLRLRWLNTMLWGGVILLTIEHIWHGELVPWPPFLTAMSNPEDAAIMVHEILTNGILMAAIVTLTWIVMVLLSSTLIQKKTVKEKTTA